MDTLSFMKYIDKKKPLTEKPASECFLVFKLYLEVKSPNVKVFRKTTVLDESIPHFLGSTYW